MDQLQNMYGISGRVGVVTGASRGIGRGIAICLAAAGAKVIVTSRHEDDLRETCDAIMSADGDAVAMQLDVNSLNSIDTLTTRITREVGSELDFLVNNAGVMIGGALSEVTESAWDQNVDVNLKGPLFCTKALLDHLAASSDGRVINISSIHALIGKPNRSAYAASKGGLVALTKQLAVELGPRRITVNAVCPGIVPTRMSGQRLESAEHRAHLLSILPLRRLGTPEDVGAVVAFLCSPAAGYVTGQVIGVDGGWSVT